MCLSKLVKSFAVNKESQAKMKLIWYQFIFDKSFVGELKTFDHFDGICLLFNNHRKITKNS